ncbi:SAM-dependent methyltransferase [Paractinoplanes durhamensis]
MNQLMQTRLTFRSHEQVASYFDGLELLDPGVVRVPDWRPAAEADRANPAAVWGGVGRKV